MMAKDNILGIDRDDKQPSKLMLLNLLALFITLFYALIY